MIVNRVTINTLEEQLTNPKIFEDNQDNDESDKYSEDKLDPIAFSIRNRKFKAELTPDERGYIIGRSVSTSVQELAKELKLSRSTIQAYAQDVSTKKTSEFQRNGNNKSLRDISLQ